MVDVLSRLWQRWASPAPAPLQPLWDAITAVARQPGWYGQHGVPDTVDGRFDMVALVGSLVMLRLEGEDLRQEGVWLTERFVADMDGSLREMGVGDLVVAKHVGRMVGALGGRLGAYRQALAMPQAEAAMAQALERNLFRREGEPGPQALGLARAVLAWNQAMRALPGERLLAGQLPGAGA